MSSQKSQSLYDKLYDAVKKAYVDEINTNKIWKELKQKFKNIDEFSLNTVCEVEKLLELSSKKKAGRMYSFFQVIVISSMFILK